MEILEDEHQGAPLGQRLEEAAPGAEGFVAAVPARIALRCQAHKRAQMALDPACARWIRDEVRDSLEKLGLGHLGGVGLQDRRLGLDHLRHGPEGDALTVWQRATLPPEDDVARIRIHRLRKLPDQSALADARNADEREKLRRPLALGAAQRVRKKVELFPPADERGAAALLHVDSEASPCGERLPDRDRLGLALRSHGLALAVLDRPLSGSEGRLADQNAVYRGCGLEARGRVDDVPGHHSFALGRTGSERHDGLTRIDSNADVQVQLRVTLVQLENGVADREGSADGALGVILVGDGGPEDRHHGVADELLHRSAEPLDFRTQAREVRREHGAHVLGVEPLGPSGEADEIGEENRDDLALFTSGRLLGCEGRGAPVAEAGAFGVLLAAKGADLHEGRVRARRPGF